MVDATPHKHRSTTESGCSNANHVALNAVVAADNASILVLLNIDASLPFVLHSMLLLLPTMLPL